MDSTYVAKGDTIDYTPPATAVDAGDVVVVGNIVAHAPRDIAVGELGALTVEGIVRFPKATGSSTALTQGTKVYWNAGAGEVTTTASTHKVAGYVATAATDDDTTVDVKLARA